MIGSLLQLVKIRKDCYIAFSNFAINCTLNKQNPLPTTAKAFTLQLTFLLSKVNFKKNSSCYFYWGSLNIITEFCYIWKYHQEKAFMFEAKSFCGSLSLFHRPPMKENFWFPMAALLCKALIPLQKPSLPRLSSLLSLSCNHICLTRIQLGISLCFKKTYMERKQILK